MSRLQWCREHIDQVAEACDLSRTTVLEVKEASKFCDSNVEFSTLPTSAILTLIRVKDEDIRARAVSLAQNALNITTPTGGKKTKGLTAKDIKKIIDIACTEIRMERPPVEPPAKQEAHEAIPQQLPPEAPMKEVLKRDEILLAEAQKFSPPKTQEQIRKEKAEQLDRALIAMLDLMPSNRFRAIIEEKIEQYPGDFKTGAEVVARALDFFAETWKP